MFDSHDDALKDKKLIGAGRTAQVYEWDDGAVVKLYHEPFEEWVDYELAVGEFVSRAGVPAPRVYGKVAVGGRKGIAYQRVAGDCMLDVIARDPSRAESCARAMAHLHAEIHEHTTSGLRSQQERLESAVRHAVDTLGERRTTQVLDHLAGLDDGRTVCHGDLFPGNIMISEEQVTAIDWIAAYRGNPLGDVARACLIFASPSPIPAEPSATRSAFDASKALMLSTYVQEYIRLTGAKMPGVDAWMLPVLAARIWERVPGEEQWLLDSIDRRLGLTT